MEFENIYNDGQLLLREDYPGEETGSSDTTANVHMDEVNVYGPDRCQTPPSAAFQHKIRTLATPSKPCDLVFSSSENSDFLEEVAKRYGLCEREVAGVRSLIDFLRRDCKILMLPIQQYVHKLLSTKAIYNVDMLLQTLQEDEAYLDVVVGKNVVHRPAILKAVQARQAEQRTKEKQQITPRELQDDEQSDLDDLRNKLQFEPESEEAHDLQMLYTIMVSTTNMLSACALCLCECVAVSWGCVAVETVKTALQESDAKLSMEGLQEVTRQLGEKAWGVFVESAWDKFADQLKQEPTSMSIPTTPLAPIASLMTSVNRTYQMFLKSLVRQDAGAVAWLLSAAKLLRHDGTEDPLHGRDVMMLAKGFVMYMSEEGICGQKKDHEAAVKLGAEVFSFLQQALQLLGVSTTQHSCLAWLLGYCYHHALGTNNKAQPEEAFKLYIKAASQDNMAAQFSVALCYQGGQGVSQNHSEAVKFLRLAAKGGHLEAIHCLALCFENGQGLAKDDGEAVRLFTQASQHGHVAATYHLALCYEKGYRISHNHSGALQTYLQAAMQGHVDACYSVAVYYEKGVGVESSLEEAKKWFGRAAEGGHATAQKKVKELGSK